MQMKGKLSWTYRLARRYGGLHTAWAAGGKRAAAATRRPRGEPIMGVTRTHHYTVEPADVEELLARRAALITAVRAAYPGLAGTQLTRLEDGTFADSWRWDTAEHMRAASPATSLPEARAAMSLTRDHTARSGEIVDER